MLVVLLHVRTSLIIASTIPLAALSSFLIMSVLRRLGWVDIQAVTVCGDPLGRSKEQPDIDAFKAIPHFEADERKPGPEEDKDSSD